MSYALQDAVWEIKDLKAAPKIVLMRLAHYVRDATEECYPSLATLAECTGLCRKAVIVALRELERRGFIRAVANRGRGGRAKTTRWLLVFTSNAEVIHRKDEVIHRDEALIHRSVDIQETVSNLHPLSIETVSILHCNTFDNQETVQNRHPLEAETVQNQPCIEQKGVDSAPFDGIKGVDSAPEPISKKKESKEEERLSPTVEPVGVREAAPAGVPAGGFEEFYAAYPRKIAPRDAAKAYAAALKTGTTHAEIMAGVARYADEREGQDPRYTAHPATWLRAGRWADEQAPAAPIEDFRHDRADSVRRPRSGTAWLAAGVRASLGGLD